MIKRGDLCYLDLRRFNHWYLLIPEEVRERELRDIAAGDVFDSAGEPKLYSAYGQVYRFYSRDILEAEKFAVPLIVVSKRPKWEDWRKRPARLIECFDTNLARRVLIQLPRERS